MPAKFGASPKAVIAADIWARWPEFGGIFSWAVSIVAMGGKCGTSPRGPGCRGGHRDHHKVRRQRNQVPQSRLGSHTIILALALMAHEVKVASSCAQDRGGQLSTRPCWSNEPSSPLAPNIVCPSIQNLVRLLPPQIIILYQTCINTVSIARASNSTARYSWPPRFSPVLDLTIAFGAPSRWALFGSLVRRVFVECGLHSKAPLGYIQAHCQLFRKRNRRI